MLLILLFPGADSLASGRSDPPVYFLANKDCAPVAPGRSGVVSWPVERPLRIVGYRKSQTAVPGGPGNQYVSHVSPTTLEVGQADCEAEVGRWVDTGQRCEAESPLLEWQGPLNSGVRYRIASGGVDVLQIRTSGRRAAAGCLTAEPRFEPSPRVIEQPAVEVRVTLPKGLVVTEEDRLFMVGSQLLVAGVERLESANVVEVGPIPVNEDGTVPAVLTQRVVHDVEDRQVRDETGRRTGGYLCHVLQSSKVSLEFPGSSARMEFSGRNNFRTIPGRCADDADLGLLDEAAQTVQIHTRLAQFVAPAPCTWEVAAGSGVEELTEALECALESDGREVAAQISRGLEADLEERVTWDPAPLLPLLSVVAADEKVKRRRKRLKRLEVLRAAMYAHFLELQPTLDPHDFAVAGAAFSDVSLQMDLVRIRSLELTREERIRQLSTHVDTHRMSYDGRLELVALKREIGASWIQLAMDARPYQGSSLGASLLYAEALLDQADAAATPQGAQRSRHNAHEALVHLRKISSPSPRARQLEARLCEEAELALCRAVPTRAPDPVDEAVAEVAEVDVASLRKELHAEGHGLADRLCGKDEACGERVVTALDHLLGDPHGDLDDFFALTEEHPTGEVAEVLARFEAYSTSDAVDRFVEEEWVACLSAQLRALNESRFAVAAQVCQSSPGAACESSVNQETASILSRETGSDDAWNTVDSWEGIVSAEDRQRWMHFIEQECVSYRPH